MQKMVAKNMIDEAVEHSINKTQYGGAKKIVTQKQATKKKTTWSFPTKSKPPKGITP